eukprot:4432253-Amphidinium_carterae.1
MEVYGRQVRFRNFAREWAASRTARYFRCEVWRHTPMPCRVNAPRRALWLVLLLPSDNFSRRDLGNDKERSACNCSVRSQSTGT